MSSKSMQAKQECVVTQREGVGKKEKVGRNTRERKTPECRSQGVRSNAKAVSTDKREVKGAKPKG